MPGQNSLFELLSSFQLQRFIVKVGENVTKGDIIGYEGSTGPHVHFMYSYPEKGNTTILAGNALPANFTNVSERYSLGDGG